MREVDGPSIWSECPPSLELARPIGGRRPLADAVHGDHGSGIEVGGEEGAGRVREVVVGEDDPVAGDAGERREPPGDPVALGQPGPHRAHERVACGLAHRRGGRQHAVELDLRVLVEGDVVDRARLEAELDRAARERGVVLLACEALLLGGEHERTVLHPHGSGVVEVAGDSEDAGHDYPRNGRQLVDSGCLRTSGSRRRTNTPAGRITAAKSARSRRSTRGSLASHRAGP